MLNTGDKKLKSITYYVCCIARKISLWIYIWFLLYFRLIFAAKYVLAKRVIGELQMSQTESGIRVEDITLFGLYLEFVESIQVSKNWCLRIKLL